MRSLSIISLGLVAVLLAGCTVGPNYRRPTVASPPAYRNSPDPSQSPSANSFGDEKWWAVFQDEQLQKLIRSAIQQNYNVQIAASRIAQAQAQVGITRANQFPTVSGSVSAQGQHVPVFQYNYLALLGAFSWDPDFWGKYRRATEAARADLLASEWNRREVISTLVSNVASAYLQLRELDLELEIARQTLASRQQSLKLTQTLESGGATSLLDVRQAEQLVETAAAAIPDLDRQIGQQEDLISILIGDNPHDVPRGLSITQQPLPSEVPAGIPSRLLERRPDILQAEQQLVAANAQIGAARAALFPDLPLTISAGFESPRVSSLFSSTAYTYSAPLTQPIFEGGKLRANVRLTEAQEQQAVLTYKQAIQNAFQQVSDALIAYRKYREYYVHEQALTAAAKSASDLSAMRYRGGATSYLEVLTSETNYFAAQLNLARAELSQRLALVQLYTALGGGWQ